MKATFTAVKRLLRHEMSKHTGKYKCVCVCVGLNMDYSLQLSSLLVCASKFSVCKSVNDVDGVLC